jgi:predicted  nucleic acid-binding Zn-ribbon protein
MIMNDLFVLSLRVEAALDVHRVSKAIDVEDLIEDVTEAATAYSKKAQEANNSRRNVAAAKAVIAYLDHVKPKLELRLRELERAEQEAQERYDYMARVAQREYEALSRPVDRGRPDMPAEPER